MSRGSVRRLRTDRVIIFFSTGPSADPSDPGQNTPGLGFPEVPAMAPFLLFRWTQARSGCGGTLLERDTSPRTRQRRGSLCSGHQNFRGISRETTAPQGLPPLAKVEMPKPLKPAQGQCPSGPEAPDPAERASSIVHDQDDSTRDNHSGKTPYWQPGLTLVI